MSWRDHITVEVVNDLPTFSVADALPLVLDRLEVLDPELFERIGRANNGNLTIRTAEASTSSSEYSPLSHRIDLFSGDITGYAPEISTIGNTAPDGSCVPIALEDLIIHELVHASDPWLQVVWNLSTKESTPLFAEYMQIALSVQANGMTDANRQWIDEFYTRNNLGVYGFTPEFLREDALIRLRSVAELLGTPPEQLTAKQLNDHFAKEMVFTGGKEDDAPRILHQSTENWATNKTEQYLQQLYPLTAEQELGDYYQLCNFNLQSPQAQNLPYSHIEAEQAFLRNINQAVVGISGLLNGFQVQDSAALLSPTTYFAEFAVGKHRPAHGLPD